MKNPSLDRRTVLQGMAISAATLPLANFIACGVANDDTENSGLDSMDASTVEDGGSSTDGGQNDAGVADDWATGGTSSMTGNYPDPFSDGIGTTCTLTCAATLGPCYANTLERMDISEGQSGLPVRLAFLIIDEACNPIDGAEIDIWHTSATGLYSGEDASNMCTFGDAEARAGRWFRGVQTTDSSGRADFDTCFPGWYSGRTIHIHFTIRVGGTEYVTSQLFFDDSLSDEIIATQPIYSDRGARDTTNTNDNVIRSADIEDYVFRTERMPDGAMLASKAIVIRSSVDSALCQL